MSATSSAPVSTAVPDSAKYVLKEILIEGMSKLWHQHQRFVTVQVDQGEIWTYDKLAVKGGALRWTGDSNVKQFTATSSSMLQLKLYKVERDSISEIGSIPSSPVLQFLLEGDRVARTLPMEVKSKKRNDSILVTLNICKAGDDNVSKTAPTEDLDNVPSAPLQLIGSKVAETESAVSTLQGSGSLANVVPAAVENGKAVYKAVVSANSTWGPLLQNLSGFMMLMDGISEIHPYAKMAWSVLSGVYKAYKDQLDLDEKVTTLADKMKKAYDTILAHEHLKALTDTLDPVKRSEGRRAIERHAETIQRLSVSTIDCALCISKYAKDRYFIVRLAKHILTKSDEIDSFTATFDGLNEELEQQSIFSIESMNIKLFQNVGDIQMAIDLQDIKDMCLLDAVYDSEQLCLEGTRESILDEIKQWKWDGRVNDASPRVRLLLGEAGTGKSAIANTVAHYFHETKPSRRLAASFRFSAAWGSQSKHRGRSEAQGASETRLQRAIPTLAWQLAEFDPVFRAALWKSLRDDWATKTTSDPIRQFEHFILNPAQHALVTGTDPLFIVIDALDEIGDVRTRKRLLDMLSNKLGQLPPGFRVLLTSRPDKDILAIFEKNLGVVGFHWIPRFDKDPTLVPDIENVISVRLRDVPEAGLGEEDFKRLAAMSQGLFEWARVACDHIVGNGRGGHGSPRQRYEALVQSNRGKAFSLLDTLYEYVLPLLVDLETDDAKLHFRVAMGLVLHVFEPLTMDAVRALSVHLTGVAGEAADNILPYLGAFLSGVSETSSPILPLHSSFHNFLTERGRSKQFYIGDPADQHTHLATSCLRILTTGQNLHFNMCQLQTSYRLNRDIPDLQQRIQQHIPFQLSYASRFWGRHLDQAQHECTANLIPEIRVFLEHKYLYWLEVLSLTGAVNSAAWSLSSLVPLIAMSHPPLCDLARDCLRFVRNLARAIADSTPHIYLSALPAAPKNSPVKIFYGHHYRQTAQIFSDQRMQWPSLVTTLMGHGEPVTSVAFSPDGKRIVSSSRDRTVRVWDAETGQPVGPPLEGHTHEVTSVAFSPNGRRIVSGSGDKTVRVWDAETGQPVGPPLEGHTHWVSSVAFSPNGRRIVSGSGDKTVRVWDAETGQPVGPPLEGHTHWVSSVAFSPDGKQIVSGSYDKTVRVWDAETGQPIGPPLDGHTGPVTSVAFSPDGKRIVSSSRDRTVRVWDAETGQPVGPPLEGHTHEVTSVAFSPDGKRIVSGSWDNTVRVWDAETRQPLRPARVRSPLLSGRFFFRQAEAPPPPLEGHTAMVSSVVFSPDGKRIVSGSWDKTVRVWDAETGQPVGPQLDGHTQVVTSVAFSPDGKRIVSGSWDKTVRVWDAETGQPIGPPLDGHTGPVNSVAFSPDGKRIVSGSDDKTVRVWDAETGQPIGPPLDGHTGPVTSVAFSPDGKRIVSGSWDRTVRVWDAETGQPVGPPLDGHTGPLTSVAFSPDGKRMVSGSWDRTVRVWDAETGQPVGPPLVGHTAWVTSVAFSPDGKRIVSSSGDRTVRVWDAETGQPVGPPLHGHTDGVTSVAFSSDGKQIVSGSRDKTLRVWETTHIMKDGIDSEEGPVYITRDGRLGNCDVNYETGWITCNKTDYVLWIPLDLLPGLCLPPCQQVLPKSKLLVLDLSHFVHGERWVECRNRSES